MHWLRIFSKPHPFIFNIGSVLLPGIITFMIIGLLAPFGFQNLEISNRIGFALMLGAIASFSIWFVVGLLKQLSTNLEESWTVGKEILLILSVVITIATSIFVVFYAFNLSSTDTLTLFRYVFINTVVVSVLPVTILVLFEQYNHQKKQWKKALSINEHITESKNPSDQLVQLKAENGKIELQLKVEEILYLKSEGNYVEVFYLGTDLSKKLIRNRLKSLTDSLPEELFFPCHKSYVVNKNHIVSVNGNARNFELNLRGTSNAIPVSRSKSSQLEKLLS